MISINNLACFSCWLIKCFRVCCRWLLLLFRFFHSVCRSFSRCSLMKTKIEKKKNKFSNFFRSLNEYYNIFLFVSLKDSWHFWPFIICNLKILYLNLYFFVSFVGSVVEWIAKATEFKTTTRSERTNERWKKHQRMDFQRNIRI